MKRPNEFEQSTTNRFLAENSLHFFQRSMNGSGNNAIQSSERREARRTINKNTGKKF